jgi:mono/diheme cytochrome c family protein
MRRLLKWLGLALGLVLVLGLLGLGYASWRVSHDGARTYAVADPPLAVDRSAANLARGAHLFATRGCADCHGKDAAGHLVFDAGPVAIVYGPNLTRGGRLAGRTPDQIAAAIRHGVRADGTPLVVMPSDDFRLLSDADVGALVAYMQSLPPSAKPSGETRVRPLGRLLYVAGKLPLYAAARIDHAPRARPAPVIAATAEYGQYLAQGCTGCHGADFAGQHVPGTPPEYPDSQNLTPAGIGDWTQADFRRALREGRRPDGSAINPFMPWKAFAGMTDVEIDALYAYLHALPPVAKPVRKKP